MDSKRTYSCSRGGRCLCLPRPLAAQTFLKKQCWRKGWQVVQKWGTCGELPPPTLLSTGCHEYVDMGQLQKGTDSGGGWSQCEVSSSFSNLWEETWLEWRARQPWEERVSAGVLGLAPGRYIQTVAERQRQPGWSSVTKEEGMAGAEMRSSQRTCFI